MGSVLRFIAWVLRQGWRYGYRAVRAAASWARRNWSRTRRLIEILGYVGTLEYILRLLGYL